MKNVLITLFLIPLFTLEAYGQRMSIGNIEKYLDQKMEAAHAGVRYFYPENGKSKSQVTTTLFGNRTVGFKIYNKNHEYESPEINVGFWDTILETSHEHTCVGDVFQYLYSFKARDILDVKNISESGGSVGFAKVILVDNSCRLKFTMDGAQDRVNCQGYGNIFQNQIDVMSHLYFPFNQTDEQNFSRIKKAFMELKLIADSKKDPFDD